MDTKVFTLNLSIMLIERCESLVVATNNHSCHSNQGQYPLEMVTWPQNDPQFPFPIILNKLFGSMSMYSLSQLSHSPELNSILGLSCAKLSALKPIAPNLIQ